MTTTQKITYYILLVLTSALFLMSGFTKLAAVPQAVQGFQVAHLPIWFMYFIGICETLGAIGLWLGNKPGSKMSFAGRKISNWAAYGLFIILIGAIVTTAIFVSVSEAIFPALVAVILGFIVWLGNKKK